APGRSTTLSYLSDLPLWLSVDLERTPQSWTFRQPARDAMLSPFRGKNSSRRRQHEQDNEGACSGLGGEEAERRVLRNHHRVPHFVVAARAVRSLQVSRTAGASCGKPGGRVELPLRETFPTSFDIRRAWNLRGRDG